MGQYYHPINITKREILDPHLFGDGLKLLEFSQSEDGVMTALALLLASGNGRGGGDFSREPVNTGKSIYGNCGPYDPLSHERIENEFTTPEGDQTYRTIVPKIVGRWAGDQIVIAGDYMDKGIFITPDMISGKTLGDLGFDDNKGKPFAIEDVSLYDISLALFKDISLDVLWAMLDDKDILNTYIKGDFFHDEIKDICKLKTVSPKKYPLMIHDMRTDRSRAFLEELIKNYS